MPRDPVVHAMDMVLRTETPSVTMEERVEQIGMIRATSPDVARRADAFMVGEILNLRGGLAKVQANQAKLEDLIKKLTATPWVPAVLIRHLDTAVGKRAIVSHGGHRRVVGFADEVDPGTLSTGDEVYLGHEMNVIVACCQGGHPQGGETASFERHTADGRVVLKVRDEEIVVEGASCLKGARLKTGDLVRWDRVHWIAFERLERAGAGKFLMDETPEETFDSIGGLDAQIEEVKRVLSLFVFHKDTTAKYRLRRKKALLLVGPPGTGKTMIARALANHMGTLSRSGRARFLNVRPSELNSMWFGQSEERIREVFRTAREAGKEDPDVPVVMFFDELESLVPARGSSLMQVDHRIVTAFAAELNGIEDAGNILVVGATNRRDAMDPAIARPGRMGDKVIEVPRPGISASRDIFFKHIPADIPFDTTPAMADPQAARAEIIEAAVSQIYAPNGDGEVATLRFRDGKTRPVRRADLVSGATIGKIAADALEAACMRELEGGPAGLRLGDVLEALGKEFESQATTLTPANCRQYVSGLPQDMDIVSLEPCRRRIKHKHRYLSLTAA